MLVIAVPSVTRLVLKPIPSEHASESLLASVMKTPSKPASSAARAHSIIVGRGLSGMIEKASAILAMMVSFVGAILPQTARSLDIVHRRPMATVAAVAVARPVDIRDNAMKCPRFAL